MVVKNDVVMAENILEGGQRDAAPPKAGWRSKVPIMACGAGLFSDGYLNGVCEFNPAPCLYFVNVLPRLLAWSILYSSGCGKKNMVLKSSVLLHLYVSFSVKIARGSLLIPFPSCFTNIDRIYWNYSRPTILWVHC